MVKDRTYDTVSKEPDNTRSDKVLISGMYIEERMGSFSRNKMQNRRG